MIKFLVRVFRKLIYRKMRVCEKCGYPLNLGRPYGYEYDPMVGKEVFTGTYWYQCDCWEEK